MQAIIKYFDGKKFNIGAVLLSLMLLLESLLPWGTPEIHVLPEWAWIAVGGPTALALRAAIGKPRKKKKTRRRRPAPKP